MTASPVSIERHGGAFRLSVERSLPGEPDDVFAFFADARNLERITPPWLRFRMLGEPPQMATGALIDYRLRLHGVPIAWQTEITVWEPPHRFVDVQRRGPFRRWVHEHTFEGSHGTTVIRDAVDYTMFLPRLSSRLVVARDLRAIFEFRQRAVAAACADATVMMSR